MHWVLRRREVAHLETMGSWGEAHFRSYYNEDGGAGEMAREELGVSLGKDGKVGKAVFENELDPVQYGKRIPNCTV